MKRGIRAAIVLAAAMLVAAPLTACDLEEDSTAYRTVLASAGGDCEGETVGGGLPPELDGEFDLIDPTTGAPVIHPRTGEPITVEFTIDDNGQIWDARGNEVTENMEGCIDNWSFSGISERGTPYTMDWDMDLQCWVITNQSGTPRAICPQ